uniref:Flippase-like domain-containing protein n=1 Tax=Thermomicrobium roseum TaxID=500 RepID=A0A7C1K3R2_THERO
MRRMLVLLVLAIAFGCAVWAFRDPDVITTTLSRLSPTVAFMLLALLGANELIKGLRWAWYLRAARLPIRLFDGLTSYLAAQAASAVPGGALLSARLAEEHGDGQVRLRHTTPPLLAQGLGDLIAVSLVAATGIALTAQSSLQFTVPVGGVLVAVLAVAAIRSERIASALTQALGKRRLTRRIVPAEEDARRTLLLLCRPHALGPGIAASIFSSLIAVAILLLLADAMTLRGLGPHEALYVHGMTMLAHLLLPIPNGFGTSELSLVGLLNVVGIGFARATAIAVTYRALGLGFRTMVGLLILVLRYHHLLVELRRRPVTAPASAPALDFAVEGQD